jgi:hypothetical protein
MTGCRNIHALLHGSITHDPSVCLGINTTSATIFSPHGTYHLRHYSTHLPPDVTELKKKWEVSPVCRQIFAISQGPSISDFTPTWFVSKRMSSVLSASVAFITCHYVQKWYNTTAIAPMGLRAQAM